MMTERKFEKPSKKRSFKNYCLNYLKECDLTGFSSILNSRGWSRKLIKIILLCFGIAGFLLQTFEFLQLYWQYSTTTTVKVMSKMEKPSITICDDNVIRRRFLCENNPEFCERHPRDVKVGLDRDLFCGLMEEYCLDPNDLYFGDSAIYFTRLPKQFYDINFTRSSGFEIEKNLLECTWLSNGTQSNSPSTSCGKPEFVRGITAEKYPGACYTIKSSLHMLDNDFNQDTALRMIVRWRTSDLIRNESAIISDAEAFRFYWIAFHFPGQAVNPFIQGISIKEGYRYNIKVSQVDTIRLPPPYSTNCFDYLNQWKKNQFEGPLRREDCQAACKISVTYRALGCVTRDVVYPHDKELCYDHTSVDKELNAEVEKCMESCRDACKQTDYVANVKREDTIDVQTALKTYGAANVAILDVSFDISNSETIEHEPIYETVELFSYIGGYLGIWLGWSVLALFDFFEIVLNVCMHPFIRRQKPKKKNRTNIFVIPRSDTM